MGYRIMCANLLHHLNILLKKHTQVFIIKNDMMVGFCTVGIFIAQKLTMIVLKTQQLWGILPNYPHKEIVFCMKFVRLHLHNSYKACLLSFLLRHLSHI